MTTVKATCPDCGVVEMTERDVTLYVCTERPALSRYEFVCPACHQQVDKSACDEQINLLLSVGVATHILDIPCEALEPHVGPPLTLDDLLDFALELRGETALAEWAF